MTINGKFWDMNQLSTAQETIEEGLEAIGIKSDDIGVEGVMPSIGAKQGSDLNTTGGGSALRNLIIEKLYPRHRQRTSQSGSKLTVSGTYWLCYSIVAVFMR